MTRLLILILTLLTMIAAAGAADRPVLYGFAPAYPADTLPTFTPPEAYPRPMRTREVVIELTVDKGGRVKEVTADDTTAAHLLEYVRPFLSGLSFVPAERAGKKIRSQLPIAVTFPVRSRTPDFRFPIDEDGHVTDREKYFAAIEANGVTLPRLVMFPPYFTEVHWSDTLRPYPFVLLKLSLDADGIPIAIDTVRSTQSGLTMTTASAALWAQYQPAVIDGKSHAADCFLLVSYFPAVIYPTARWRADRLDSASVLERMRVQVIADTVGLMAKPIARRQPGNALTLAEAGGLVDTVSAVLAVDTAGHVSFRTQDRISPREWQVLRRLSSRMPFYPARDYRGEARYYDGPVRVILDSSEKVRIEYVW